MKTTQTTLGKLGTLAALAFCGLQLTACLSDDGSRIVGASKSNEASLGLHVQIPATLATSGKASAASSSEKLVVTLTSDVLDTLRDTISVNGSTLSSPSVRLESGAGAQVVSPQYTLKPDRTWQVSVKTVNADDSTLQTASNSIALAASETRESSISLAANLPPQQYLAKVSLPDSTVLFGDVKVKLNIDRVVLKVDGKVVVDTTGSFTAAQAYSMSLGALTPEWHVMEVDAYGPASWQDDGTPLFSKSQTLDMTTGSDSYSVTSGANGSGGKVDAGFGIVIGKVGKVTLNYTASGQIDI